MKHLLAIILSLCLSFSIAQKSISNEKQVSIFTDNVFHLSEVMLHDVANPPAAARFYSYTLLGAFEVAVADGFENDIASKFKSKLEIKPGPKPKQYNQCFAATYAMLDVGRQIMPSGSLLAAHQESLVSDFGKTMKWPGKVLQENVEYAKQIANQVVAYARADGYNKLSTYKRYTPEKGDGKWFPTPPEYMGAVEPRWETIRTFYIESSDQFSPVLPNTFNLDSTSAFFKQMKEVYTVTKSLTDEQKAIASFWDCNPFAVTYSGHMAIGLKKISPGGHWIGITGIACKQTNLRFDSTLLVHATLATTLHDAFVSCWTEKYNSNRIRPETAINKYLDSEWRPMLQTPPFPEYTSGHSVISSACSTILTSFFGDNFGYTDSSEEYFGLPARKFKSFYTASDEAAISRLYGGIHFRDACEEGVKQGRALGNYVIRRLTP